jgi:cytochrome c
MARDTTRSASPQHWIARSGVFAAVAILIALPSALAQQTRPPTEPVQPDPEKGYALAERFCQTCHLIAGPRAATASPGLPSLRAVANLPGQSATRIRNALMLPPHQMPDMALTMDEIAHLTAYLDTLRTDRTRPLIEQPLPRDKPKFPSPS